MEDFILSAPLGCSSLFNSYHLSHVRDSFRKTMGLRKIASQNCLNSSFCTFEMLKNILVLIRELLQHFFSFSLVSASIVFDRALAWSGYCKEFQIRQAGLSAALLLFHFFCGDRCFVNVSNKLFLKNKTNRTQYNMYASPIFPSLLFTS